MVAVGAAAAEGGGILKHLEGHPGTVQVGARPSNTAKFSNFECRYGSKKKFSASFAKKLPKFKHEVRLFLPITSDSKILIKQKHEVAKTRTSSRLTFEDLEAEIRS